MVDESAVQFRRGPYPQGGRKQQERSCRKKRNEDSENSESQRNAAEYGQYGMFDISAERDFHYFAFAGAVVLHPAVELFLSVIGAHTIEFFEQFFLYYTGNFAVILSGKFVCLI